MTRTQTDTRKLVILSLCLAAGLLGSLIIPRLSVLVPQEKNTVQSLQTELHRLETAVSSTLLDRQFFKTLLNIVQEDAPVTNDVVEKMNAYTSLPFTFYVYNADSLLYWSKPGLIIDPAFFTGKSPPLVASDHLEDFLIKEYNIYHNFQSYTVYAKIPLLPQDTDRSLISVRNSEVEISRAKDWQVLQTHEGDKICAIDFASEKLGFWQQLGLLLSCLATFLAFILWLPHALRHWNVVEDSNKLLMIQIGSIVLLRLISMLTGYHDVFNELSILTPINHSGITYSLGDVFFDSLLFCSTVVVASRLPLTPLRPDATKLERHTISVGSYLIMILLLGLFAWIQRWLIMSTSLPLQLEQISFVSLTNALVFTSLGSVVFGLFLIGNRIMHSLPDVIPSTYIRLAHLTFACLISLSFISMLGLNLPLFGFYLAALSSIILFDLFIESRNRSVIWVICWSMLIAGFEASLLHAYQSDKDINTRFALAQQLSVDLVDDPDQDVNDVVLSWLPNIPPSNSLGVFNDEKLAYSYNYAYPLLQPIKSEANDRLFEVGDVNRSEVGYINDNYTVLVGKANTGLMQVVSLFSYIFALFNIILFCLAASNSFLHFLPSDVNISFSSRPTLRNRIQVAIVFLIILSFVIIGFVTVFYLRNTTEDRDKKYFEDRLRAVATSITQTVPVADASATSDDIIPKIAGIAYVYNRKAKIFNEDGELILQSDNGGSEGRPSIMMSFVNKFEMDQSDLSYSIQATQTPKGPSYQGLLSLRDATGNKYGYIELPGVTMTQAEPETGSRFFGTLLNAYVFLFLIAVALAIGVANSITRPLGTLGDKLKKIKLGKKNEQITWAIDDEIGALINDYNSMIDKLDESAQLLALTERDTAWREMAKQVAHEIKNPLTPMKLSIQYLQNGVSGDADHLRALAERVSVTLLEQIDNLSRIASEFSNFAKMPQALNEKVLLNDIVASVHDLFRKRDDMDIQLYVPIQDIYIFADRNLIVRVLNNIVKNAIQAIPDDKRGKINISLAKQGDNAVITVEDNGTGISSDMREKVFTPNFTTKSSGTGLGLAMSANIIETFNGKIYFETEEGVGTRFYIEVPLMKFDDNLKEEKRVVL